MTGLGAVPSPGRGETLGLRQELDAAWGPGILGRSHVGRPVMEMPRGFKVSKLGRRAPRFSGTAQGQVFS